MAHSAAGPRAAALAWDADSERRRLGGIKLAGAAGGVPTFILLSLQDSPDGHGPSHADESPVTARRRVTMTVDRAADSDGARRGGPVYGHGRELGPGLPPLSSLPTRRRARGSGFKLPVSVPVQRPSGTVTVAGAAAARRPVVTVSSSLCTEPGPPAGPA